MKNKQSISVLIALCFTLLVFNFTSCSSTKKLPVKLNEHMEVGWTPRTIFQSPSYAAWYDTGYANYKPDEEAINRLKKMQDDVEIVVVYAT